jgi:hypothetical protein
VLLQKRQPAAGRVVESRERSGDEKVQKNTQDVRAHASVKGLASNKTSSNRAWNFPSEQDASLRKVQGPGNQATHGNRQ